MPKHLLSTLALFGCSEASLDLAHPSLAGHFRRDGAEIELGEGAVHIRSARFGRDGGINIAPSSPQTSHGVVQYDHPGLTEWWKRHPGGLEQGFRVEKSPWGRGSLSIEIAVDGAEVAFCSDITLRLEGDSALQVSGLAAWDATGRDLPARFAQTDGGFQILVDDRGAHYPIDIDPVYTTASTILSGEALDNWFGASVSDAGDVNGDGYGDVIVGAWGYASNTGRATLYLGSSVGLSDVPDMTWTGSAAGDFFGVSVASAGDINGDGYDDVLIGAYGNSGNTGLVHLYNGSSAGLSSTPTTVLPGEQPGSFFGVSTSGAGDVNGDGYGDVIISAHGYNGLTGRAYVYLGSSTGLSTVPSVTMDGEAAGDYFGVSVAGAGDVDADGYDDVIVGAYYYDAFTGRAYVYPGSVSGTQDTASLVLTGSPGSHFGVSVAGAGDIDADGYDDAIIGARNYATYTGRAYTFAGGPAGLSAIPTNTLEGAGFDERFGQAVSGAGDINADGYADVIVGAYGWGGLQGQATLFEGSSGGTLALSTTLTGEAAGDSFGYFLSGAGDVDNDGYSDVIVGAPLNLAAGRAYLYRGKEPGFDLDGDGFDEFSDCDDTNPSIYPGAQEICDPSDIDEDCDGLVDDADPSVSGQTLWFADDDGDGHGGPRSAFVCDPILDATSEQTDCDDEDGAIHPGADEICNGKDDDCDGTIDEDAVDGVTWYQDADGDGYTDPDEQTTACEPPDDYAERSDEQDCNDYNPSIYPGADEINGDGVDQNCSGEENPLLGGGEEEGSGEGLVDGEEKYVKVGGCGCASGAPRTLGGALGVLMPLALLSRRRAW